MTYQWASDDKQTLCYVYKSGRVRVVDDVSEYDKAVLSESIEPSFTEKTLQCTPAQMRLTLHRAGLLETVQEIADSDPEAKILWEYATTIIRNSPFIDALGSASFTPKQIDDLFIAAMAT
jgi:hypothetical protein